MIIVAMERPAYLILYHAELRTGHNLRLSGETLGERDAYATREADAYEKGLADLGEAAPRQRAPTFISTHL